MGGECIRRLHAAHAVANQGGVVAQPELFPYRLCRIGPALMPVELALLDVQRLLERILRNVRLLTGRLAPRKRRKHE